MHSPGGFAARRAAAKWARATSGRDGPRPPGSSGRKPALRAACGGGGAARGAGIGEGGHAAGQDGKAGGQRLGEPTRV